MTAHEPASPDFDRVARAYRWMEYLVFGNSLQRCRNHLLPRLAECRRALVFGDGDGRFVARLLTENRELRIDAIDSSTTMLRLLRHRVEESTKDAGQRLHSHHTNALTFEPERTYDLIVTHFFLDCLTQSEVDGLARRLTMYLRPGGLWLVSEFNIPNGAMRLPARCIVRLLYIAFQALTGLRTDTLPHHAASLASAGFTLMTRRPWLAGLLISEIWEYTPAMLPPQKPKLATIPDPVPDPEPASPSLPEPDPGVFHHEPARDPATNAEATRRTRE